MQLCVRLVCFQLWALSQVRICRFSGKDICFSGCQCKISQFGAHSYLISENSRTEMSFLNFVNPNQIWIVITIFRGNWYRLEFYQNSCKPSIVFRVYRGPSTCPPLCWDVCVSDSPCEFLQAWHTLYKGTG